MTSIEDSINNQPIMNIGMLGSVADGKSTCVLKLTGTKTQRHSNEMKRNITIKPGYANLKIWEDQDGNLHSTNSKPKTYQTKSKEDCKLVHHLSFVDCPGHHELILTMLGSINLMSGVIVVVSAAEPISKKPQLLQHLAAVKIAKFDRVSLGSDGFASRVIVILNKLDLVSKEVALERKHELEKLLRKLDIRPKVIIPTCLNKKIGVEWVLHEIMNVFPPQLTKNDILMNKKQLHFGVTRSFDVNRSGIMYNQVIGGVIGGSLLSGNLESGTRIEIRPGIIGKTRDGQMNCIPIKTTVLSIQSDKEKLMKISSGGLMALGTDIDPFYCKDDNLAGNYIGLEGDMPHVYNSIEMNCILTNDFDGDWEPKNNDIVNLQIGTLSIDSKVKRFNKETIEFLLSRPVCVNEGSLILISIKRNKSIRLVGYGNLIGGDILVY